MLAVIVGLVSCLWLDDVRAAEGGKADVVLRNGKIYTADKARSIRKAIALTGNTIVAVGNDKDMEPLLGAVTKVVDLRGKLVLPGLIDTHIHPILGAVDDEKCSLAGVKATIEALMPVIKKCLAEDQGGTDDWFEAVQLDNYGFSATAKDVDKIEAKRPLVLWGNDGHTGWVNSRGLELTGVTAETPDPPCGKIGRDASGAPTGAFADDATLLVDNKDSRALAGRTGAPHGFGAQEDVGVRHHLPHGCLCDTGRRGRVEPAVRHRQASDARAHGDLPCRSERR